VKGGGGTLPLSQSATNDLQRATSGQCDWENKEAGKAVRMPN
jgi:hypothetical protein